MVDTKDLPPLVEVFWEDHYSIGDDWFEPGHSHELCILSAVGYLVGEDDLYYYIACTLDLRDQTYSAGTAVIKKCVTEFRTYKNPKSNKKVTKTQRK